MSQVSPVETPPGSGAPANMARKQKGSSNRLTELWSIPATRALVALLFVFVLGWIFNAQGAFFKLGTHRDALRQASVYGILACGLTLVIISGGIDLAVGSVLALVAVSFSLMSIHWGWSPLISLPISLLAGLACGAVSGGITASWGIQPFIATLAMMVFARGLAKTISGGMKVSTAVKNPDGTYRYVDVPSVFRLIDSRILGGHLAVVTVIFLICAVVAWVLLSRHCLGRYLYAIGGNE
jgi:ribose transport system permease protein